jgi:hypothetical protein
MGGVVPRRTEQFVIYDRDKKVGSLPPNLKGRSMTETTPVTSGVYADEDARE